MSVAALAGGPPRAIDLLKDHRLVATARANGGTGQSGDRRRRISHVDENYAISQQSSADVSQEGTIAQSEELIAEIESSDFVVIGTPMHNFTVPSALKAWIDHVVRARRTFKMTKEGKVGRLHDRPVFVAVSSGGRFSGERARQPDFLTPYLKHPGHHRTA